MGLKELGISRITVKNPDKDEARRILTAQHGQETVIVCTHSRVVNGEYILVSQIAGCPSRITRLKDQGHLQNLYDAMRPREDANVTVSVIVEKTV